MTLSLLSLLLALIVMGLSLILSNTSVFDRQKSSPFECGFSSNIGARLPVSLRFFLIAVIFLIFDVELVLLFPFLLSLATKGFNFAYLCLLVFLLVLAGGLFYEWSQGILEWAS